LNKNDLVAAVSDDSGLTKSDATRAVDSVFDAITKALKKGSEVRLVGFGSFVPIKRAAGKARNPRTGAPVNRPASRTARFRVGEGLKSALN